MAAGYSVQATGGGAYLIRYHVSAYPDGVPLVSGFTTPEEAWAALPDRTKPPGAEPNLSYFRRAKAVERLAPMVLKAMGVETTTPRPVGETSSVAFHSIDELTAAALREHIYEWLAGRGRHGATADELNAAFVDPANRADKQLATMRRAGMITYLTANGERVKRATRMDRPAYVHVAVPRDEWVPVTPVRVETTATATADDGALALRLERIKSTGMSMVPGIRRLRDTVQKRAIGSNALTVELTGIADWLETLFKEEMEYGNGR